MKIIQQNYSWLVNDGANQICLSDQQLLELWKKLGYLLWDEAFYDLAQESKKLKLQWSEIENK